MMPASLIAEALNNRESLAAARERLMTRDHLARHYRAIGLPALAAAAHIASARRRAGKPEKPSRDATS